MKPSRHILARVSVLRGIFLVFSALYLRFLIRRSQVWSPVQSSVDWWGTDSLRYLEVLFLLSFSLFSFLSKYMFDLSTFLPPSPWLIIWPSTPESFQETWFDQVLWEWDFFILHFYIASYYSVWKDRAVSTKYLVSLKAAYTRLRFSV